MPFPNNLAQQLTSFIGRRREIAEVRRLLSSTRLLTLTGAGGCGKTRLAIQVASKLVKEYRDGVWFVDLSSLSDPALVPAAVASTLGVKEQSGSAITETLVDYLQPKKMLLILDNCEHLVEACASLANTLLTSSANLSVLATSRQALGIAGETVWSVPSLTLPQSEQQLPVKSLKTLTQYDAIRLFTERALLRRPTFALNPENAPVVTHLCLQLDGIPLAIELAAARMSVLTVDELVEKLDQRFRLLALSSERVSSRHQTLQAAMDWSYDLLSEAEQSLLRSLSVFAGGCTLEAAQAVWGAEADEFETLDLLSQLAEKSLVIMEERKGKSRYKLLETVRQYAWEKAIASQYITELRKRHLGWCLQLAEQAEPALYGPQQGVWLSTLEAEHDNIQAALRWTESSDEVAAEAGLRLTVALYSFWMLLGLWSEGRRWLEGALSCSVDISVSATPTRAKALSISGRLATTQGDITHGAALYEECLELSRRIGHKQGMAEALSGLARIARDRGDPVQAIAFAEEALALWRELKNKHGVADVLNVLGIEAWWLHNNADRSKALLEEALAIRRELGNKANIASTLNNLGEIARGQGDYTAARQLYEASLALFRETKSKGGIASVLANLGSIAYWQCDYDSATSFFKESLVLSCEMKYRYVIAYCQIGLAGLWMQREPNRAAYLLGSAEALLENIGTKLERSDQLDYDRNVASIRAQLDDEAFEKAWADGRAAPMEEAVALALQIAYAPEANIEKLLDGAYPKDLTKREVELLRLVADGLSNKEIASQLSISIHTVETHMHSIYSKLSVASRSAASRFAVEHNLV